MADEAEDTENEDGGAEEGAEGEGKKKGGLLKLGLFIGLPVIILLLGGAAAFMMLSGGDKDEHVVAEGEHADEHGDDHGDGYGGGYSSHAEPVFYTLKKEDGEEVNFLVNIRGTDGRAMILQLQLRFESTDHDLEPVLQEKLPLVMDSYQAFLSELREDDLYGSAGMHRVRLELLRRINLAIEPSSIDQVLIQRFLLDG